MKKKPYNSYGGATRCVDGESCECHGLAGGLCDVCEDLGCSGIDDVWRYRKNYDYHFDILCNRGFKIS